MPRKKKEDEVAIDVAVETEEVAVVATEEVSSEVEQETESVAVAMPSEAVDADTTSSNTRRNRASRIGVVTSDKMMKTVVVRVDRLIKHPRYRKYVRRRKQFMAHDELGSNIGDKVMIVETRPLSARKRWRVVQIIQKAER
jgi:small subunit ribosomal protein S17